MLSVKDVSTTFGVSQKTVRKWVNSGALRCFRIGDVFRFTEGHIQEFIAANEKSRDARV